MSEKMMSDVKIEKLILEASRDAVILYFHPLILFFRIMRRMLQAHVTARIRQPLPLQPTEPKMERRKPLAVFVANDAMKPAMKAFVDECYPTLRQIYSEFLASNAMAQVIKSSLEQVTIIGQGPSRGDIQIAAEIFEKTKNDQEVHLYAFMDYSIERHNVWQDLLISSAIKGNWLLIPTPAAARSFIYSLEAQPSVEEIDTMQKVRLFEQALATYRQQFGNEQSEHLFTVFATIVEWLHTHAYGTVTIHVVDHRLSNQISIRTTLKNEC